MEQGQGFPAPENPMEAKRRLEGAVVGSLQRALAKHGELGAAGEEMVEKNQFGDTALRADIECEKAVLDHLAEIGLPIRVVSEEYGQMEIGSSPKYLGVLDGIDGSSVYMRDRENGRYGTLFGIFDTTDPSYDDYVVSGYMEHSTKRLFVAVKGEGAYVVENGIRTPIHSSGKKELLPDTVIYIDEHWEINRDVFSSKLQEFKPEGGNFASGSSAVHYADVAQGSADLALECTRKKNLEIAVAYGLEKEAGAVIVDMNGDSLGDKKYLSFGQSEMQPVITASTIELARALIVRLKG